MPFNRKTILVGLMVTLSANEVFSQVLLKNTFDTGGMAKRWNMKSFKGPDVVKMIWASEGKNTTARFAMVQTGFVIKSWHTPLTLHRYSGKIQIRFRYKATGPAPVWVSVSGEPGCGLPWSKEPLGAVVDGQWHENKTELNLSGFDIDEGVFEMIFEGDVSAGTSFEMDDLVIEKVPLPMYQAILNTPGSGMVFDRSSDQNVRFELTNRSAKPGTFNLTVTGLDARQECYTNSTRVLKTGNVSLDFAAYMVGNYQINISIDGGTSLGEWRIRKCAFKKQAVIVEKGIPVVNGNPFLILGLYHASDPMIGIINSQNQKGVADFTLTREELFKAVKERGFNTVHASWAAPSREYLDQAAKHGLMAICETSKNVESIKPLVDHPAVLAWYGIDEPSSSALAESHRIYNDYKAIDPYHPLMTAVNNGGFGLQGERFVDIPMPDVYPIRDPKSPVGVAQAMVELTRKNLCGSDPTTSVLIVPQLFTFTAILGGFEPLYEQVRAEVYAGIVGGAKGVVYYACWSGEANEGMSLNPKRKQNWYLPESRLWNQIAKLNHELQSLKDVILLAEPYGKISVKPADGISYRAVKWHNTLTLFVVNTTGRPLDRIHIVGLPETIDPNPLFESPTLKPNGEKVRKLNLKPYAVAIYQWIQK